MDMTNETLITLCWELYEQGIPKCHIARRLGKHRETVGIWIKDIRRYGLLGFLYKYEQANKASGMVTQGARIPVLRAKDSVLSQSGIWGTSVGTQNLRDSGREIHHPLQMEEKQA
jgi:transposase